MIPSVEDVVLDTLRELQATQIGRIHADRVMERIAKNFLNSSTDAPTARRRAYALLRIAAGEAK